MSKKSSRRIIWMDPIQNASTKFALVREKAGLNNGGSKYFGSRIYSTRNDKGGLIQVSGFYMRKYGRSTPIDMHEITFRENFTNGVKWAAEARTNLSVLTWNQEQFKKVYNDRSKSCGGIYYTNEVGFMGYMRAYAIKTLNQGETLPTDFRLPEAQ